MSMIAGVIGFLLGLSSGVADTRSKVQRRLNAFVETHGIRLVGRDGNEIPLADLAAELKKR